MKIKPIFESVKRYCMANQAKLCTIGACVGLTGTTILSFCAGMKVRRKIDDLVEENPEPTVLDVVKVTWKDCIWTLIAYLSTGTVIILGQAINAKTISGLKAALDISETAIIAGKEELIAQFGEEKAQAIQNDINNRIAEKDPPTEANTITTYQDRQGYTLIRDCVTGEWFWDDINRIKACVEKANTLLVERQLSEVDGRVMYDEVRDLMGHDEPTEAGQRLCFRREIRINSNASGVCPENGLYPGHVYWKLQYWTDLEDTGDY